MLYRKMSNISFEKVENKCIFIAYTKSRFKNISAK